MNRKRFFTAFAVSLCVFLTVTAVFWYLEYRSYQEKLEIVCVMLSGEAQGRDNLSTAAALLRHETHESVAGAYETLAMYGFDQFYADEYKRSMYRTWMLTAGVLGGVWILFLLNMRVREKQECRKREEEFAQICMIISRMRERAGEKSVPENAAEINETEIREAETNAGIPLGNGEDDAWERLFGELSSLEESIALWHRQAMEEKEETKVLVTDISHQLKTPVAALKTSFELCRTPDIGDAARTEFMERCSVQITRLTELVGALVGISRMETGMIQIRRKEQKIFDTLLLAINRIYPEAAGKDIELALEAGEELKELILPHDAKWLSEAFINVLENAVKYSPAHSGITIRMIRMNVFLRIEIEDEGIGIPKEEWNQIFRRFYRGASEQVQQTAGSGVGLYIARRIVTEHHGMLTVKAAQKGKCGSRFVFQLPYE